MARKTTSTKGRARKAPVLRGAEEEQLKGKATGRALAPVSRSRALTAKGLLKKGCHFKKGGRAYCFSEVAEKLKETYSKGSTKKSSKSASAGTEHVYKVTSSLPFKKGCRYVTRGKHKGKVVCDRRMSKRRAAS